MNKPNGYDEIATGNFTPVELGGHHMTIKQVSERKSKTGKNMIVVLFDFSKNDKQAGYFTDLFNSDNREEKKWSNIGTQYIVTEDAEGKCSRNFKAFISSVEGSNAGFVTSWGDNFCSQFKGKIVGGVFGRVENEYNGKISWRNQLRWFCNDGSVDSAEVPTDKPLPEKNPNSFMSIPDSANEEIPF